MGIDYLCVMEEKVIILDFGSQYTQLIARRIRELNVFSEIIPFNKSIGQYDNVKGVILSGSPCSVFDEGAPAPNLAEFIDKVPVLGICYGAQFLANHYGCLLYTSPSPRDGATSRMPSSA